MNWAILLGVLFAGLSAFFLYYGTHLANQRSNHETAETVTSEVQKVLDRIDSVGNSIATQSPSSIGGGSAQTGSPSSAARQEAQQKLADIQGDFSRWASEYIKNRDLRKLELDRQKLAARTEELKISNDYRPLFQCAVDALRGTIDAYNKKAGTDYRIQLIDLPTNLYPSESFFFEVGTIEFAGGVKWRAYISAQKPADPQRPPLFQIDIQYPNFNTNDAFRIEIQPPHFKLIGFGGGVAAAARLDTEQPLDSFQAPIQAAIKKLVETQISSFDK